MLISLNQLDQAHIETGICLMGAGAAGITLARELRNVDQQVVLLESGGLDFDQSVQDLYRGVATGVNASYLHLSRLRFLGGTTNHWAGFCRPLDPRDFEAWPLAYEELVSYYQRAAELLGIRDASDPDKLYAHYRRLNPEPWVIQTPSFRTLLFQRKALNFGRAFREDLEQQANLTAITQANATELHFSPQGRLDEVRVQSLEGKSVRIRARLFVLACGGIENARILLNSAAAGLDESATLGKGFSDHPYGFSAEFIVPDRTFKGKSLEHWSSIGTRAEGFEGEVKMVVAPRDSGTTRRWPNFYLMLDRANFASRWKAGLGTLIGQPRVEQSFRVTVAMEPPWSERNRISLTNSADALGIPQVRLEWNYPDKPVVEEILRQFASEMAWTFGGRCRVEPFDNVALANHHMGTTRIGSSPTGSVVDANCKLHASPNLFVAGSSVFRSSGASNPTLTILALSIRLADHLKTLRF